MGISEPEVNHPPAPGDTRAERKRKMNLSLTNKEVEALRKCVRQAVKNGNTVNPEAFIPTPEDYKAICNIFNQLVTPT